MSESKVNLLEEKSRSFVKELLELAAKYQITGMTACGCCNGLNIDFGDAGSIDSIEVASDSSGKLEASYESRVVVDGSWLATKYKVK